MTWGQIKKDLQMYGQRLCYSNNSICCSFTPCVDVVIAAAAADFPGLPNRPAAADQYSSSSELQIQLGRGQKIMKMNSSIQRGYYLTQRQMG